MQRVTIRMHENAGVVGEDRTDWLGGTEHECSEAFAKHLVHRGLARIVPTEKLYAPVTPALEARDPEPDTRDPDALTTTEDAPVVRPPSSRNRRG